MPGSADQEKALTLLGQALGVGRAGAMMGFTAAMLGGVRAHMGLRPQRRAQVFAAWEHVWVNRLLDLFGMRLHVRGSVPARTGRGRLVVANHRSPVDILIAISLTGGCVLSRADLEHWPILGAAAREAGTIFVDRESRRSGALAIREIRKRLQAGYAVVVFPEGATFEGDEVRPFHAGAFAAAQGLDVEVLPLGLCYPPGCEFLEESFPEHVLRVLRRPRTDVGVTVGEVYPLLGHREQAAAEARRRVQDLVHKARAQTSDADWMP